MAVTNQRFFEKLVIPLVDTEGSIPTAGTFGPFDLGVRQFRADIVGRSALYNVVFRCGCFGHLVLGRNDGSAGTMIEAEPCGRHRRPA